MCLLVHCQLYCVRVTEMDSRRFLRELDEAPGENNLQYILKCPCIPFFGNQGLHNEIMLGGNGGRSGVMCEGSLYILGSSIVNTVNLFTGEQGVLIAGYITQNPLLPGGQTPLTELHLSMSTNLQSTLPVALR